MKKIFLSLAIIIAVSSFSILLTKAYFTDKKTINGNTFTVGTLNLEVGGSQNSQIEPFVISDLGNGEISGQKVWNLKNTGSLSGRFTISLNNILNNENGCNAPESEVDQTCNNPGTGEGELNNIISVNFYINNVLKISIPLNETGIKTLSDYWSNELTTLVLEPGQQADLKIEWFESGSYGNEIQSDSLSFDLNFNLQQVIQ